MTLLPSWWRTHFLNSELVVAVIGTIAFICWIKVFGGAEDVAVILADNRTALYGTLGSIFGSLLGFTITATSIVLVFSTSPRLRIVRASRHYPTLWKVFRATIRALALTTILSLAGLVFDRDGAPCYWVLFFMTYAFLLSCLRVARVIWVLENIVLLLTNSQRGTDGKGAATAENPEKTPQAE